VKKIQLTILVTLSFFHVFAQQKNYVTIAAGDSAQEIIRKASNIVPSARQLRWQQLELTAFFHLGVNTFTDREWGTGKEDPKIFNPSSLDARQWVRVAKEAGIKQVILTAKHHDGFCLWPSKTTKHSVAASPWKNGKGNVVKEVSNACKEYGIGFGIYLSPWDMNASMYGTDAYNDFFIEQLTELLGNYGVIDEVWFDGANGEGPNGKKQVYDFERWYKHIRKMQPSAVIAIMGPDIRWVGTETGYGRETEWSVVPTDNLEQSVIAEGSQKADAFKPQGDMMGDDLGSREKILKAKGLVWYPAETDVSIRPGWFYHSHEDDKVKSPQQLLDIYFNSVGRNGVLLLNIPPDRRGLIHENDAKNLYEWKKLRDEIFKSNLVKNAVIKSSNGKKENRLKDGKASSHLIISPGDTTTVIELKLKKAETVNLLLLQENIQLGQRIESFVFEYMQGNEWIKIVDATTVGHKRLLQFDAVKAERFRLRILSSRLEPVLAEIGLYWQNK
jgi:alpha-L-fucosidase